MVLFESIASRDEPFDPARVEPLILAVEGLEEAPLDIAPEEFFDFLIHTDAEEAREVLYTGAVSDDARRRAGAAFVSAISGLIRAGHIAAKDVGERLAVAGQIQGGTA